MGEDSKTKLKETFKKMKAEVREKAKPLIKDAAIAAGEVALDAADNVVKSLKKGLQKKKKEVNESKES